MNKTVKKFAHDYRDMAMNEFDLAVMLENFLHEYEAEGFKEIGDDMETNFAVKSSEATEEEVVESNRQIMEDKVYE